MPATEGVDMRPSLDAARQAALNMGVPSGMVNMRGTAADLAQLLRNPGELIASTRVFSSFTVTVSFTSPMRHHNNYPSRLEHPSFSSPEACNLQKKKTIATEPSHSLVLRLSPLFPCLGKVSISYLLFDLFPLVSACLLKALFILPVSVFRVTQQLRWLRKDYRPSGKP